MSDSESENYSALDFEKNFFTTQILCWNRMLQILNLRYFGMSDFIKVCKQKITLPSFTPRTRDFLLFPAFLKIMTWKKKQLYTSDFRLKKVHRLGFWNKKVNGNASDFDLKVYNGSDFEMMKKTSRQIRK